MTLSGIILMFHTHAYKANPFDIFLPMFDRSASYTIPKAIIIILSVCIILNYRIKEHSVTF